MATDSTAAQVAQVFCKQLKPPAELGWCFQALTGHQFQRPAVLVALPAGMAGVVDRAGRLLMLGSPGTGTSGPWGVTGGGGPKLEGSLPAAVSGPMAAPECMCMCKADPG